MLRVAQESIEVTGMNAKDLKWYVYRYNCNSNKIETYNVVGGKYFLETLKKMMKKYSDKNDFAEALKSEMMYHFWSRAEWELIVETTEDNRIFLSPWVGCKDPENVRIDATDDTGFDWRGFAELHTGRQIYKNKAKIDVYDQLDYVWDDFVDYCWNSKVYKPRKKKTVEVDGYADQSGLASAI